MKDKKTLEAEFLKEALEVFWEKILLREPLSEKDDSL